MVTPVSPSIPQDMRDLLIRLDQRVDDGFKNMNDKLDAINRRADGIDGRVRTLEDWRSEVQGGAKGIGLGWKVSTALIGAVLGILGYLGVHTAMMPAKQVVQDETTIERKVTIPAH